MAATRRLCAVMLDTTGREIYVDRSASLAVDANGWPVHGESFAVAAGASVALVCGAGGGARPLTPPPGAAAPRAQATGDGSPANPHTLHVSYAGLAAMVQPGDNVVLGRYLATGSEETSVYLTVTSVDGATITATAGNDASLGGLLTVFHCERSADGLSNAQNDLPALCADDKAAIAALAAEFEIDFVSLSFTRSAADVADCRAFLDGLPGGAGTACGVLAKLETRQSLLDFDAVLGAADGVILSRGNLGLDVLPEKMALVQKVCVSAANQGGKPILMTRVVDTMVAAPRPTRAEATDVANAVLDGVDAILLGAETLRGKHPVATVETVLAIAHQAEAVFDHARHFEFLMQSAVDAEEGWASARGASHGSLAGLAALARGGSSASLADEPITPSGSFPALGKAAAAAANGVPASSSAGTISGAPHAPYLSRLEAVASSAVRAAAKVRAALVLVYTQSGQAAHLVAKYRPPVPIVALVIPRLSSDGMTWKLEGRGVARQALIVRGLLPVLAAPAPSSESLLEESIVMASSFGLVKPGDHVVVVQMVRDAFAIKIVTVDADGASIAKIRPKSLMDLMKATAGVAEDGDMAVTRDGLLRTGSARNADDAAKHPHLAFGSVPVARGALTSSPTMLVGDAVRSGEMTRL
jgi:pyruvate kinase